jgi:hypothetical protein
MFVRPIHWQDAVGGGWKAFDNTLRPIPGDRAVAGFAVENTANAFRGLS